jgi:hypothetical protein
MASRKRKADTADLDVSRASSDVKPAVVVRAPPSSPASPASPATSPARPAKRHKSSHQQVIVESGSDDDDDDGRDASDESDDDSSTLRSLDKKRVRSMERKAMKQALSKVLDQDDHQQQEDGEAHKDDKLSDLKCVCCNLWIAKEEIDSGASKAVFCGRHFAKRERSKTDLRLCGDCTNKAEFLEIRSPSYLARPALCTVCKQVCLDDSVAREHCSVKCHKCRSVIHRGYIEAIQASPPECPSCAKWPVCSECDAVYSPDKKECAAHGGAIMYTECYVEVPDPHDEGETTLCGFQTPDRKSTNEHMLKEHKQVPCSVADCYRFFDPEDKSVSVDGVCTSCFEETVCGDPKCEKDKFPHHRRDDHMISKHGAKRCERPVDAAPRAASAAGWSASEETCMWLVTAEEIATLEAVAKERKMALPALLCAGCEMHVRCTVCMQALPSAESKVKHLQDKHGFVRCNGAGCTHVLDPKRAETVKDAAEKPGPQRGWRLCDDCC